MSKDSKGFFQILSKNMKKSFGPGLYQAGGSEVTCIHCRHNQFESGRAQLNTALSSFLNLDFTDRSAAILTCSRCGYVHWFNKKVYRVD